MSEEKKPRKTRVVWSAAEIRQVAESALLLSFEDTENLWDLVSRSQECLPKSRRRNITGRNNINQDMVDAFRDARKEYFDDISLMSSVEIEVETEIPVEKTQEDFFLETSTEDLIAEVARRMIPIFAAMPAFMERIIKSGEVANYLPEKTIQQQQPAIKKAPPQPKVRLPKVLLLEFLPQQEDDIRKKVEEKELQSKVELVFGGKGRREQVPRSCNWLIINTKVSHSLLSRIQKKATKERRFMVNGINAAVERIELIVKEA